jgi:shikimate kinase
MINKICITGFRAVGKTTLGKSLANKLQWKLIDTDLLIAQKAGVSIADLTEQGKNWEAFRALELEVLEHCLKLDDVVLSMGGGMAVNDVIEAKSGKTYGELGAQMLKENNQNFVVLLTAPSSLLKKRIYQTEVRKAFTQRPVFDPEQAEYIAHTIEDYKNISKKEKERLARIIVKDSMAVYKKRKNLYPEIAHMSFSVLKRKRADFYDEVLREIKNYESRV